MRVRTTTFLVFLVCSVSVYPVLAKDYDLVVKWKTPLYTIDAPGKLGFYQIMADLDNDGKMEILVSILQEGYTLAVLNADGSIRWRIDEFRLCSVTQLAVGDITGDSKKEIVLISRYPWATKKSWPRVHAYDTNGNQIWAFNLSSEPMFCSVTIADIDGDGKGEVLAPDRNGNIVCLDGDGKLIWNYASKGTQAYTNLAVGDVTGNGLPEVVSASPSNLTILEAKTGRVIFTSNESAGIPLGGTITGPILVDIYPDPGKEIVIDTGSRIVCVNGKGEFKWQYNRDWPGPSQNQPAAGDLDGDGRADIVFGSNNNTLTVLSYGERLWEWKGPEGSQYGVQGGQAIADLDGDGFQEVIWNSWDGNLYVADGRSGRIKTTYTFPASKIGFAAPMVGDVDGDGRLEIVVTAGDNVVYCLAAPVAKTGNAVWPLWRFDPGNTGNFELAVPEGLLSALGLLFLLVGVLSQRTKHR